MHVCATSKVQSHVVTARILEEEFEKREKLEQLKTELEGLLEEERHKREGLEEERQRHETMLTEEQLKLEQLEQERLNMDAKMEVNTGDTFFHLFYTLYTKYGIIK